MSRVSYDSIVEIQDRWQTIHIPQNEKDGMVALINKLMHKLIDNGHELDGVQLEFPEDCNDYNVFMNVSYALSARVKEKSNGGYIMSEFCSLRANKNDD